jgi:hypothetical protein
LREEGEGEEEFHEDLTFSLLDPLLKFKSGFPRNALSLFNASSRYLSSSSFFAWANALSALILSNSR